MELSEQVNEVMQRRVRAALDAATKPYVGQQITPAIAKQMIPLVEKTLEKNFSDMLSLFDIKVAQNPIDPSQLDILFMEKNNGRREEAPNPDTSGPGEQAWLRSLQDNEGEC
jgi:hypothetical protein